MTSHTVLYSGAKVQAGLNNLGSPHYSYRFAEAKFLACFRAMQLDTRFLEMPEYYSAPMSYEGLGRCRGRLIHFIFRSTEAIRLLKDGYNISCFAWEFPHLKDSTADGEHPFSNQKRMLSICDEIWVPCGYTKDVLVRHGIANVHCIPAPVQIPDAPRASRADVLLRLGHLETKAFHVNFLGNRGAADDGKRAPLLSVLLERGRATSERKIYLSVFNPEDFRKNLDALVRGFDAFQQRHPDAILLIKALTSTERFSLHEVVTDVMTAKLGPGSSFANDSIVVLNQFLTDDEMTMLYDVADFYVCTSLAEGQNLPLLEAMARGVVPVTTRNTAMLDYIDDDDAIVIEADRQLNQNRHLAGNVAGKPYEVELCSSRQVAKALGASAELDEKRYAALSRKARDVVAARFSHACLQAKIQMRLDAICGADAGTGEPVAKRVRRWGSG